MSPTPTPAPAPPSTSSVPDWAWAASPAIAILALVIAAMAYARTRRINADVAWVVSKTHDPRPSDPNAMRLTVQNTGIGRARDACFDLHPMPSIFLLGPGPDEPVTVERGATIAFRWTPASGVIEVPPSRLTVTWRRRLWRDGRWSTPI